MFLYFDTTMIIKRLPMNRIDNDLFGGTWDHLFFPRESHLRKLLLILSDRPSLLILSLLLFYLIDLSQKPRLLEFGGIYLGIVGHKDVFFHHRIKPVQTIFYLNGVFLFGITLLYSLKLFWRTLQLLPCVLSAQSWRLIRFTPVVVYSSQYAVSRRYGV